MARQNSMPELHVKKVVAVCFLEAAQLTLEQLAEHRLGLSQQGLSVPGELPRLYGELRRLREYLQRCVHECREVASLDLVEEDADLLVASCRRSVEAVELRLRGRQTTADERRWLERKRQVLGDWAVELVQNKLVELPLPRIGVAASEAVRALDARLRDKIHGDVTARVKIVAPGVGPLGGEPPQAGGGFAQGIATFGEHMAGDRVLAETDLPAAHRPASDGSALLGEVDRSGSAAGAAARLLDDTKVRDPRLRALVHMDLAACERAEREGDYRVAAVMLASVMEAALLDHAIPRRGELELRGQPDSWDMPEVLTRAMGDAAQPKDRALAFHLFAARNMLRPALQMVAPKIVTAESFERLLDLSSRALHAMGFGAPRKTLPPGAARAEDCRPV